MKVVEGPRGLLQGDGERVVEVVADDEVAQAVAVEVGAGDADRVRAGGEGADLLKLPGRAGPGVEEDLLVNGVEGGNLGQSRRLDQGEIDGRAGPG